MDLDLVVMKQLAFPNDVTIYYSIHFQKCHPWQACCRWGFWLNTAHWRKKQQSTSVFCQNQVDVHNQDSINMILKLGRYETSYWARAKSETTGAYNLVELKPKGSPAADCPKAKGKVQVSKIYLLLVHGMSDHELRQSWCQNRNVKTEYSHSGNQQTEMDWSRSLHIRKALDLQLWIKISLKK